MAADDGEEGSQQNQSMDVVNPEDDAETLFHQHLRALITSFIQEDLVDDIFLAIVEIADEKTKYFCPELENILNIIRNGEIEEKDIDMNRFFVLCFGIIFNLNEQTKALVLQNPLYFADKHAKLVETLHDIVSKKNSKFQNLTLDLFNIICGNLMKELIDVQTKRTKSGQNQFEIWANELLREISTNHNVALDFNITDLFGRIYILMHHGPVDALLACFEGNWNSAENEFEPLLEFESMPHVYNPRNSLLRQNTGKPWLQVYIVDTRNENKMVVKLINLDVRNRFADDFAGEATNMWIFNNLYNNSLYEFTGPSPYIIKLHGVTRGTPTILPNRVLGDAVGMFMEKGTCFFDWFTVFYGKNGKKMRRKWREECSSGTKDYHTDESEYEQNRRDEFIQMLLGLYYMHKNNMYHRDIKLENFVILDPDGEHRIKFIDFGLCRKFADFETDRSVNDTAGTRPYLSPENIKSARNPKLKPIRHRQRELNCYHAEANDVWTLGIVLFQLLFGFPPWKTAENIDPLFRIGSGGSYLPPEKRNPQRFDLNLLVQRFGRHHVATDLAKDLLRKIFVPEDQRITLEEILQHPWIKQRLEEGIQNGKFPLNFEYPLRRRDILSNYTQERTEREEFLNELEEEELEDVKDIIKKNPHLPQRDLIALIADQFGMTYLDVRILLNRLNIGQSNESKPSTVPETEMNSTQPEHDYKVATNESRDMISENEEEKSMEVVPTESVQSIAGDVEIPDWFKNVLTSEQQQKFLNQFEAHIQSLMHPRENEKIIQTITQLIVKQFSNLSYIDVFDFLDNLSGSTNKADDIERILEKMREFICSTNEI